MQWGINTSSPQQTILAGAQAKSEVFQGSCMPARVCVFPQMTVNPLFCVQGFVGLVINARVSMNVYVCVAEWGYQAIFGWPRACVICDCQRLGSDLLHQPLLAFWLTPEKWVSQEPRNRRAREHMHKYKHATNKHAARQHTPDLLINTAFLAFMER